MNAATHAVVDDICARAAGVSGEVRAVVADIVDAVLPLASERDRDEVINRAAARLDGLDALEELLADDDVDEVMVNHGRELWVDRQGRLSHVGQLRPGTVEVVLERVLAPTGQRLDRTNPIVDARLPDGARLCAAVGPVSLGGTTLSIRRHRHRPRTIADFADHEVCTVLAELVERRCNLIVTGATSSGKTSLLSALVDLVGDDERLVLIEDTSEIVVDERHHVVRLEARPAGLDGVEAIDLSRLVRTALRLRPDRLLVGEFRGREVVAVVEAMNTGHDGSLSTCHANGAVDGLRRIETLVMQSAPTWPLAAIRRQVSRSIDAIIHVARDASGARRVRDVVEIVEGDGEPNGQSVVSDARVVGCLTRGRR